MCGRYASSRRPEDLVGLFQVQHWDPKETLAADWNVAPTKGVWAVLSRPQRGAGQPANPVRQLRVLRWGLVPSWSKQPTSSARMINARAETIQVKPAYRAAFGARRCLLPADGYYEWHAPARGETTGRRSKQPYFITTADGSAMAMAGLYDFWRDRALPADHPQAWWCTCTVVTVAAETAAMAGVGGGHGPQSLADIHSRMPLVLAPDRWDAWLDPGRSDPAELRPLLTPPPPKLLTAYPVSTEVSDVTKNGPQLTEPIPEPDSVGLW